MWKTLIFGKYNLFARPFRPLMFAEEIDGEAGESTPYDDDKMSSFMNDKFPVGDPKDPPPPKAKEEPPPKAKEEPSPKPRDTPPADNLPPGFDPAKSVQDPAPKPDEKEPDLKDLDHAIESEKNENKKINLKHFRTKLTKQEQELSDFRSKIEALKTSGVIDDQLNPKTVVDPQLDKKLTEAYDTIGRLSLAHDPRFLAKYQVPMQETLLEVAQIIVGDSQDQAEIDKAKEIAWRASNMRPVERLAMIKEHAPDGAEMAIALAFREFDKLALSQNKELRDHRESMQKLEQNQTIKQQTEAKALRDAIANKVSADLEREGFLHKQPGNEVYNKFIDQLNNETQQIIESNDVNVQARAMMLGPQAVVYRTMYERTQKALNDTLTELAKYKEAKPKIKGGNEGDESKTAEASRIAGMSIKELARHVASGAADAE